MDFDKPLIHIMTDKPITINKRQSLSEARELFTRENIHHLPVVEDEKLVGIISSNDLVKLSLKYESSDVTLDDFLDQQYTVDGIMQKQPVTIGVEATIREAADLLAGSSFHALPVVGYNGFLKGIVTSTDMINLLIRKL